MLRRKGKYRNVWILFFDYVRFERQFMQWLAVFTYGLFEICDLGQASLAAASSKIGAQYQYYVHNSTQLGAIWNVFMKKL